MADLADFYEELRRDLVATVSSLSEEELALEIPATDGWTIKDVVCHLTGDAACTLASDFPSEFFDAFGDEAAIRVLNQWTDSQVRARRDLPLETVVKEWDEAAAPIISMMRGEQPWPEGVSSFADRVLLTDLTVHTHDIAGALGVERDKTSVPVKVALSGYLAILGLRLQSDGVGAIRFQVEDKFFDVGGEDPETSVNATRFEFFRALSGRRNPGQISAYEWTGDPKPYIPYFYPYGVRAEALVE
ncbi:MAG: hypothetical protein QOG54_2886 [Actinomycetota bacterium]|jgi:uncharacterized protein (TIGR03083 family)|nr:hypothetical protein [Actinomycetota bacterium]